MSTLQSVPLPGAGNRAGSTRQLLKVALAFAAALLLVVWFAPGRATPVAEGAGPGMYLYVASEATNQITRYDARTGAFVDVFVRPGSGGLRGPRDLTFGPDGNLYVASYNTHQVLRYDGRTGAFLGVFVGGPGSYPAPSSDAIKFPVSARFGSDGRFYVAAQGYSCIYHGEPASCYGGSVQRYDGVTGAFVDSFIPFNKGIGSTVGGALFGPDGHLYASSGSIVTQITRFDGKTGALIGYLGGSAIAADRMVFGPDGSLYAINIFCASVDRYDIATGALVESFIKGGCAATPYPPPASSVDPSDLAFGPDGNLYVSDWASNRILRYDGATGRLLGTFVASVRGGAPLKRAVLAFHAGPSPLKKNGLPAQVTVAQRAAPSLAARRAGIVTLTITVTNRGKGSARDAAITLPFDPNAVRVLDAALSRASAWVSARRDDALIIRTGPLSANGGSVTAVVRLVVQPGAADGARLLKRLSFTWDDAAGGGAGTSNLPALAAGGADADGAIYPLSAEPASAAAGVARTFASDLFAPGEPVGLWYNTPDGRAVTAAQATAGADGTLRHTFSTAGLPPGGYSMVAHGLWSDVTALAPFEVH